MMETDSSMTSLEDSSDNERCEDQGTNKTSENFISDVECKCSEKLEDKQSDALDLLNDRAAKRHRRNSSSEDENVDTAHDQPRRTRRAQSNDGFSADPAWSDFSVGAHWYPAVFNFEDALRHYNDYTEKLPLTVEEASFDDWLESDPDPCDRCDTSSRI